MAERRPTDRDVDAAAVDHRGHRRDVAWLRLAWLRSAPLRYARPWSALLMLLLMLLLPSAPHAAAESVADPALRSAIAAALVTPDGQRFVAYRWPHEPQIVALYFGADWCAPCHAFVPTLKNVRASLLAAGADTEVVYVSLDGSEREMRRYMRLQQMPWPALDHRRLRALPAIRALGGLAPPALVLIDRDGRILDSAWTGRRYRGLQPVLTTWLRQFESVTPAIDQASPQDAGSARSGTLSAL